MGNIPEALYLRLAPGILERDVSTQGKGAREWIFHGLDFGHVAIGNQAADEFKPPADAIVGAGGG